MNRRSVLFILLATVATAIFSSLGLWQIRRLGERRAANAIVVRQMGEAPVPVERLPDDSAAGRLRHVTATGTYDYEHEVVLAGRTHEGSPGVHVLTPLRIAGDTLGRAVLVNRGWIYSPDGATVQLARWHEPSSTTSVVGYAQWLGTGDARPVAAAGASAPTVRRMDRRALAQLTSATLLPFYIILQGDTVARRDSTPVKLLPPALDEGPHRSYAIQWFAFALITVAGTAAVVRGQRT